MTLLTYLLTFSKRVWYEIGKFIIKLYFYWKSRWKDISCAFYFFLNNLIRSIVADWCSIVADVAAFVIWAEAVRKSP